MKTLIIGNFGFQSKNIGGQTIKTRNILQLYRQNVGVSNIEYFDVEVLYDNKIKLFFLIRQLICCKDLVIVPGQALLKSPIFSIILFFGKFFSNRISLFAVGGWLSEFLSLHPSVTKKIKKIDVVFVESDFLKLSLAEKNGLTSVSKFPNFRIHNFQKSEERNDSSFRIVFMARITPDKGCDLLFDVMDYFNSRIELSSDIILDFYGPIDKEYEKKFFAKEASLHNVNYKGIVPPDDVFKVLSAYDICILPTRYEGEGFPGTIIDSYIAGIPVIVSNWKNLPEFVESYVSGFVFELDDFQSLLDYILLCIEDKKLLENLKIGAHKKSLEYSAEKAWQIVEKWSN